MLPIIIGNSRFSRHNGGNSLPPGDYQYFDDTYWESPWWSDQASFDGDKWIAAVSGENPYGLQVVDSGPNALWSVQSPPYRPNYLRLALNSGPDTGGSLDPFTIRTEDRDATTISGGVLVDFADWDQSLVLVIHLNFQELADNNLWDSFGSIIIEDCSLGNDGPYITSISFHDNDPQ